VAAANEHFETMQAPGFWFLTASKLAESAEVLVSHNESRSPEVLAAKSNALAQAKSTAMRNNTVGVAKIDVPPLNYVPAFLLFGFALENLFKGILVKNDPTLISGTRLNGELNSHDLSILAKNAKVSLSASERKTCERLTAVVVWAGRYPAPTKPDTYNKLGLPQITTPAELFLNAEEDLDNIRAVVALATATLKNGLTPSLPTSDAIVVWKE
jgi:hypothetical protein